MRFGDVPSGLRVGWWAEPELGSPQAALAGALLRAELGARCPGLRPVLVCGPSATASLPGFSGEPCASPRGHDEPGTAPWFDVVVMAGSAEPGGPKVAEQLSGAGARLVAVAPEGNWGLDAQLSVGPPFAVPEPTLLASRHFPRALLDARQAYLRVVEGLPARYVLVEDGLLEGAAAGPAENQADLALALEQVARRAGGDSAGRDWAGRERAGRDWAGRERAVEIVVAVAGPLADDPRTEGLLRLRRAGEEEGRYQPEDWAGNPGQPQAVLRVTNPLDLAAAVAGAEAVVARTGSFMALGWALGVPHIALGPQGSSPSDFAAWTGDASALARSPAEIIATIDSIFARRGEPPGLKRLEATLDQFLDDTAARLRAAAAELATGAPGRPLEITLEDRVSELEAANGALRRRLAAERLRFGERAALLEKAANTSVESAIKAVHGQDVIVRRRLEQTEREMHRLQEETAVQQAELRSIYSTMTMRALAPARQWYGRVRRAAR